MSGRAVVGDVNVYPAIAVEVGTDDSETGSDGCSNSCLFGDVFECTVSAIMEKTRRHRLIHFRRAIVPLTSRGITLLVSLHCEVQIVRYKKVEAPVVIIIDPRGACAPTRVIDPGLDGDIGEGTVTVIVVENVMSEVCDVEVLEAVVIVVTDSDSHSVAYVPNSSSFRDVDERELSGLTEQISEEPVPRLPTRRRRKPRASWILSRVEHRPLHQIDI